MFTLLLLSPITEALFCTILLTFGRELGAFSRMRAALLSMEALQTKPEGTGLSCLNRKLYAEDYYIDNILRANEIRELFMNGGFIEPAIAQVGPGAAT